MIVLDTSLLIDALTGPRRSAAAMREAVEAGERFLLPTLVLYEWLRGPRLPEELDAQEALLPSEQSLASVPPRRLPRPISTGRWTSRGAARSTSPSPPTASSATSRYGR